MNHPPSVDRLARSLTNPDLPHPLAVEVARSAIATDRVDDARTLARRRQRAMLNPVLNATGVLLHTNLGRAPLGIGLEASYANVELDLTTGQRGSRQATIGATLATACGAEAAMVVNNCASAVMLILAALGTPNGVVVSRGEMVEIGGGFRIPDVMAQSGARLVEVGTTNRCRVSDYTNALASETEAGRTVAAFLKVHRSNYKVVGFTEEASVADLAATQAVDRAGNPIPVLVDIGSGLLDAGCPWIPGPPPGWLADEPAVRQTLEAGADLVAFSGDKLFGGPQAGIIAGRADLVERCGRHPLARALRPGSLVLNALQTVTLAYLDRRGHDIPFWAMATTPVDQLETRARRIAETVDSGELRAVATEAVPGGGTLPTVTIASFGLRVGRDITDELRANEPPIVARVADDATIIDLRTINPDDDPVVTGALNRTLHPAGEPR